MTKRRDFIKTSVAGAAGLAIGGIGIAAKSYASIVGANDRINLAVIGIRNQGTVHINSYCALRSSK
ncbi:MAG TPA: twin-arginine translocation signal domain-containing protein, partial [Acidobacteriota bacterium]|nr:twin-arginine translocation signal domain-containing protein [Acidobacteriota bacterium]